jgi:hypothetical protein
VASANLVRLPNPREGYDRENEAETRRLIELAFQRGPQGGGLPSRRQVTHTTASLATNATENSTFDLGAPGATLRTILADRAARVRFYATAAARTADATREFTTAPQAGVGVLGDFVWLSSHTKIVSPHLELFNADSPVTNTIYVAVTNLSSSTAAVALTMVVVSVEA